MKLDIRLNIEWDTIRERASNFEKENLWDLLYAINWGSKEHALDAFKKYMDIDDDR